MAVGKSHVISWLHQKQLFPLHCFLAVDPDRIRSMLPEYLQYNKLDRQTAGERTQKEVGLIAEVVTLHALGRRRNVLVEGSLHNDTWYATYFAMLRESFPHMHIAVLAVGTTNTETILSRALRRGRESGREVPIKLLLKTAEAVPRSVDALGRHVELAVNFINDDDDENKEETSGPVLVSMVVRGHNGEAVRGAGDDNEDVDRVGPLLLLPVQWRLSLEQAHVDMRITQRVSSWNSGIYHLSNHRSCESAYLNAQQPYDREDACPAAPLSKDDAKNGGGGSCRRTDCWGALFSAAWSFRNEESLLQ